MLLQVVSVMVAPFGTTRMASAVANCSEGPWAVARWPPAAAKEPHRRLAINKTAGRTRLSEDMSPVYTELERATAEAVSATAAAPALASTRWLSLGFAALTRSGDWRWGQQCCGLDRKTPRAPCGIKRNHHETNRLRTAHRTWQNGGRCCDECCDQKSHRDIFADFAPSGRNP